MPDLRRLDSSKPGFRQALERLVTREAGYDRRIEATVGEIIEDVRARGDAALLELTARFDHWAPRHAGELEIPPARRAQALQAIGAAEREALELPNTSGWRAGPTRSPTARCSGSRSAPWTGSDSTCPAARRPIPRRC
jgi:hypothetical protein